MIKKNKPIYFLITGGTIDSIDKDITYPLINQGSSIIPTFIKSLKLDNDIKFSEICFKDSREISKDDLRKILDVIKNTPYKCIIITTGTFGMPDIGRFLELNLKKNNKTIVLTGSMTPIYGFPMSDGPFNLGYAISQVQSLPKGVYACMNGKTLSTNEVIKIVDEGKFDSILE
jgi:L-asparaginase